MIKKDGTKFETFIDTDDLERIKALELNWHADWNQSTLSYYAKATKRFTGEDGKRKGTTVALARVIMNVTDPNIFVDHKNHNTLDNRKENLRVTNDTYNSRHRETKNKNNKCGYRNVFYSERDNEYIVQLMVNGKNARLGSFNDVHKADNFAKEMRKKYYGEYAGGS